MPIYGTHIHFDQYAVFLQNSQNDKILGWLIDGFLYDDAGGDLDALSSKIVQHVIDTLMLVVSSSSSYHMTNQPEKTLVQVMHYWITVYNFLLPHKE